MTGLVRRGLRNLVVGLWVVRSPMGRHTRDHMTDNEMTCETSSSRKLHCDAALYQTSLTEGWWTCTKAGAIIDEWSDDWGSGTKAGCGGSICVHPSTGTCDELRANWIVCSEWFGLNGLLYCRDHPANTTSLTCASDHTVVGDCAFLFCTDDRLDEEIWSAGPGVYLLFALALFGDVLIDTGISEQFVRILLIILQQILSLLL